ncbi:tetratricopeptide repeat protein [Pedobacter montanisoli]|uniref:HTH luxR-type domain-containing protein n=1 Tax=Pedobacter montanisoli TaxID=2923277 RepID=A0ABS9ZZX1_9SPHI|nr:hypothetical protein [Pedobacter montanisoli]MCJ0743858.1 hypothetical protein [Pedobacter montanisoli]
MRLSLVLFIFMVFAWSTGLAQERYVEAFADAWSKTGTSQTDHAENTYTILRKEFNAKSLVRFVDQFKIYLQKNPDERLKARLWMFDVLGRRGFKIRLQRQDTLKVTEAIKLARNLKDDQLLAEIYALAADMDYEGGCLLYNLKALEIQKRIGHKYFSYVQNRFLGASLALYKTKDFLESIKYGQQCLAFKHIKVHEWDPKVYIFQLDVMGASYLALKQYDKAINYYEQILDTLHKKPLPAGTQELWQAIAKGNIGKCLFYQGNTNQALPLINEQLKAGIKYNQPNNVAIAQNARAEIFLSQKQYQPALTAFRAAFGAALASEKLDDQIKALKGMATIYTYLEQTDSSLYYQNRYGHYLQKEEQMLNNSKLSAINAKILFDHTQRNLEEANTSIQKLKQTRTAIIIAIVLLSIIGWLLYNRQALKARLEKQKRIFEGLQAKAEVDKAKKSLQHFRNQMLEKDKLIVNLSQSLQKSMLQNNLDETLIGKKLWAYVLVTDAEWENFRNDFNKAYPVFYPRLHAVLPSLTAAEERLASLMFLQMDNKEIAGTLGIAADSVARSKRRLKNKLSLNEGETLESYILSLV